MFEFAGSLAGVGPGEMQNGVLKKIQKGKATRQGCFSLNN